MNKNNIIVFILLTSIVTIFYLFMHYQLKSAEDIIDTMPIDVKPTAIATSINSTETQPTTRVQEEFFEVNQIDDGFDIDPSSLETVIGD